MKKLGTVKNIKIDEYVSFVTSMTPNERVERYWSPDTCVWGKDNAGYNLFKNSVSEEIDDAIKKAVYNAPFSSRDASGINYYTKLIKLFLENNVPIPYVFRNKYITVLNLTTELATVLNEFVEVSPLTDVDALPISKIKQLVNTVNNTDINNVPDTLDNSSIKSLKNELTAKQEELEKCKKETQEQIDAYRQKLDEQMRVFREEIMKKQNELFAQKQTLLDQVFVLEDKIMDLRCVLKESFDVVNISTGPRCEKERPVIVYQKFRYIEDEIVRLTTLQAIQFSGKHKLVEQMIKANPVLLETLCPTEKCVTVCKMTKNNKYYVRNDFGFFDTLETLHGNQLFVLLRDGKQVDGLWIDEDIFLQDNLFITEGTNETEVVTENTEIRSSVVKKALSRKYLFIILQVCINEGLINISKDTHILEKSNNIIFSNADRLIDVNLYPNLNSYVDDINKIENCKVGDAILVVQTANGSSYEYNGYRRNYHDYRGNGNNDRAHDAHVSTGLNKINAIIEQYTWGKAEKCVFVSAEKEWSSSGARANVRLEEDEYINLTWVSSNHIQYWIDTKKIGSFSANSYAQLCSLLKEALQYVQKREKTEFEFINNYVRYAYIPKNIDILTEWKYKNKIRNINRLNVKKFIQQNNLS